MQPSSGAGPPSWRFSPLRSRQVGRMLAGWGGPQATLHGTHRLARGTAAEQAQRDATRHSMAPSLGGHSGNRSICAACRRHSGTKPLG